MGERVAVVHADESCLGNGREGSNPGGAGSLIEVRVKDGIARRDVYICAPATTNNRMALSGAIATLALLGQKGKRLAVAYVSDSEYLVKGMREWAPGWIARGWKRKGGAVENLELWQALVQVSRQQNVDWRWVRGHAGHPKNEYANDLAIRAAREQRMSAGAVESDFPAWFAEHRAKGEFPDSDPDAAFAALESEMAGAR